MSHTVENGKLHTTLDERIEMKVEENSGSSVTYKNEIPKSMLKGVQFKENNKSSTHCRSFVWD